MNRYEIEECLGSGSMGVVHRAHDRMRGEDVALKNLHRLDAVALFRFKNSEFRALADLHHPNLVTLYELAEHEGQWFITMELVRGVDFLHYVRPGSAARELLGSSNPSPPDVHRLRHVLPQLAQGIQAIHAAGKLHCDIKPSNVMVTHDGRVVILDFGVVTELAPESLDPESPRMGTIAYMAPEQAQRTSLTEAVDWYAFGVLLYQALTGCLPFQGDVAAMLEAKKYHDPPSPRAIVPATPVDLDDLCVGLVQRRSIDRLDAVEIFDRLGLAPTPPGSPLGDTFVGRTRELSSLHEAFGTLSRGVPVAVLVRGPSGIGKTSLIRRFAHDLQWREKAVVLQGRCYERESIPYKAFDALVDRLTEYLARLSPREAAELVPSDLAPLAQIFPVLGRLSIINTSAVGLASTPDPQQLRRRAFAGLREMLCRIGNRSPLVVIIDDLHWGDDDSAALLLNLLSPPGAPNLLLVGCFRDESAQMNLAPGTFLQQWTLATQGQNLREINLETLSSEEARELVGSGRMIPPVLAEAILREGAESPLFLQELIQRVQLNEEGLGDRPATFSAKLEDMIRERIAGLNDAERRLLEVVAVAGHPVPDQAALRAAGVQEASRQVLFKLRSVHLTVNRVSNHASLIEPYHNRVREAVLGTLSPEDWKERHLGLADALSALWALRVLPEPDPELLMNHYKEGGDVERAVHFAELAADRAVSSLAFNRAVDLYRLVLGWDTGSAARWRRQQKLGEALANSGRGRESAESFVAAAREFGASSPGGPQVLDLLRQAAEQYLRSGHINEGVSILKSVLASVGVRYPKTPFEAMSSILIHRVRLELRGLDFTIRGTTTMSEDRVRLESYSAAAVGLSMVDSVRAADFQLRHELLALDLGDPVHIVRGLSSQVARLASEGGAANRRRAGEILELASELARRVDNPRADLLTDSCRTTAAYFGCEWRKSMAYCRRAIEVGRDRCTGVVWELDTNHLSELWTLAYLGELSELSRRLPLVLNEARERDDVFAATNVRLGLPNMMWLVQDRPCEAQEQAKLAMLEWNAPGFNSQHYFELIARTQIELYRGDVWAAWRTVMSAWPKLRSALLLRLQLIRTELHHLRARCALAAASSGPNDLPAGARLPDPRWGRRRLLRLAAEDARIIDTEDLPWCGPLAALVRAGTAAVEGDASRAAERLGRAALGFDRLDMSLYAAAARIQEGDILGGEEGQALRQDAIGWMEGEGVVNPRRMAAMLVPGCGRP